MPESYKHLEKVLHECAQPAVSDATDPWPAIRERVGGERAGGTRVGEEQTGEAHSPGEPHGNRHPRLVPNTFLGWALAMCSVLILGGGIYAVSGSFRELFGYGLPGPAGPGVGELSGGEQPAKVSDFKVEVDQTQTRDGAKVTLDWAYADEKFVAVGLDTRNLDSARKPEGSGSSVLEPSLWDDTVGNEAKLPPYVRITDGSGQDFDTVGGGTNGERADAVFDAPEGIKPGREHRFRLEVPLQDSPALSGKPEAGPFVFDFEISVRPAPTIELDQEVEAEGVTLTLERVVASPAVPQAIVCFDPPDDEHDWMPFLKYDPIYDSPEHAGSAPQELKDGCWSLTMADAVEGRSSVTVTNLEGMPRGGSSTDTGSFNPKTIRGPWTFEFEAP